MYSGCGRRVYHGTAHEACGGWCACACAHAARGRYGVRSAAREGEGGGARRVGEGERRNARQRMFDQVFVFTCGPPRCFWKPNLRRRRLRRCPAWLMAPESCKMQVAAPAPRQRPSPIGADQRSPCSASRLDREPSLAPRAAERHECAAQRARPRGLQRRWAQQVPTRNFVANRCEAVDHIGTELRVTIGSLSSARSHREAVGGRVGDGYGAHTPKSKNLWVATGHVSSIVKLDGPEPLGTYPRGLATFPPR